MSNKENYCAYKIEPCPLCGANGILKKIGSNFTINPIVIRDVWKVFCEKNCCSTDGFADEIFHNDCGTIHIEHNGAREAVEVWNRRNGVLDEHVQHFIWHPMKVRDNE